MKPCTALNPLFFIISHFLLELRNVRSPAFSTISLVVADASQIFDLLKIIPVRDKPWKITLAATDLCFLLSSHRIDAESPLVPFHCTCKRYEQMEDLEVTRRSFNGQTQLVERGSDVCEGMRGNGARKLGQGHLTSHEITLRFEFWW